MGKPVPYDYRVKIIDRRKNGESAESIAQSIPYSLSAVHKLWARYQQEGEQAFETKYSNCGRPRMYKGTEKLVALVRDNEQGANYVVSKLAQHFPQEQIPSERTLQRRWAEKGTNLPKGRPVKEKKTGVKKLMAPGK